jgi:hypothetical protein
MLHGSNSLQRLHRTVFEAFRGAWISNRLKPGKFRVGGKPKYWTNTNCGSIESTLGRRNRRLSRRLLNNPDNWG